jgi:hypothetical protein
MVIRRYETQAALAIHPAAGLFENREKLALSLQRH